MRHEKIVYIVHCIDAEGPLYESIEATFQRLKDYFGIEIKASSQNLRKLQNKEIVLPQGLAESAAEVVLPERLAYNDNWDKISRMLEKITPEQFRKESPDSFGGGWVYNWFCLDHAGFEGENPRRKDLGFHNVFDYYRDCNNLPKNKQDGLFWHFHPLPLIKEAHRSGTAYLSSPIIFEVLARKIIDRKWFPAVFRPGFHTERPDSNWFLEQWIPFDYANQAAKVPLVSQPDFANGRFGDWRRAPAEWVVYHPSHDDYQRPGNCRRWIARCLDMNSRVRQITKHDIEEGFNLADSGKPALISFINHDFRDMAGEINKLKAVLKNVSEQFPDVKFKYVNAVEGMRGFIGLKEGREPNFKTEILKKANNSKRILIKSEQEIFGPQPFFALKTKSNQYFWDNLNFQQLNEWSYTFDFNTLKFEAIDKIGIAANSPQGITEVVVIDAATLKSTKNTYNKI